MAAKRILVVDNHPVMLRFMAQLLSKRGHEVLTAQDGLEALKLLDDRPPDVAFIDLVMPNISGDKLCQIVRGIPAMAGTRLIILSAVAADQMGNLADFGADGCIPKGPFPEMAQHVLAAVEDDSAGTIQNWSKGQEVLEEGQRQEITRELLSVKRHLEVIMMSMSEGILELNHDSRVVYANPSALGLLGIPEERLLGSYFLELFDESVREEVKQLFQNPEPSTTPTGPDPVISLNGKDLTFHLSPIRDEENKTIVVLNDITEQKRMETQLRQAQKMEAIGTLAGGIAHDFNNLLMAIQGTASLLLFTMDPDSPQYAKVKSIEKQVESGAKLTGQLLGYARKGKYEIKAVDLNQTILETSETFGRTKKEITLHAELAEDLWATEADEGQIEQVLWNLFVNAANAMPDGGRLYLKTANTTHKDMVGKLYSPRPGRYVMLTVTDTGTGMDEKTASRVFEPFFTTKEMGRGTGLGLASAYGIVKNHGGYIDVESKKGVGTTFHVYLPASEKKNVTIEQEKPRDEVTQGHETILLVDDERMILEVGKQLLEAMGYQVFTAHGGTQAVNLYREKKEEIDLLILDMVMPEMNGSDVYDKMKEINPGVKVLLSSGYSMEGQASKIMERGCDGFIQKPFHMGTLSQSIRQVLNRRPEQRPALQ